MEDDYIDPSAFFFYTIVKLCQAFDMCIYFNHIDWHLILMKEFLFVSLGKELSHLLPRFDGTILNRSWLMILMS